MSIVQTETKLIPIEAIAPNPWNPNEMPPDLMEALVVGIKTYGILQSCTVREVAKPGEGGPTKPGTGKYEMIDGEHRWRGAKEAGHTEIWGTISQMNADDAKAQTIAMNRLRGAMDPAQVAQVFKDLADAGVPMQDLADRTGYKLPEIEAAIHLLDFQWPEPPDVEPGEEEWVTFNCRMPVEVWTIVSSELDRLKQATGTDHDFRALEAMAVQSAQTPLDSIT